MVRFACWKDCHLHMGICSLLKPQWPWWYTIQRHSLSPATSLSRFPMSSRLYSWDGSPWLAIRLIMPPYAYASHYNWRLNQRLPFLADRGEDRCRWPALLPGILDNPSRGNTFLYLLPGYYSYSLVPISPVIILLLSCTWSCAVSTFFWLVSWLTHSFLYMLFLTHTDGKKYRFSFIGQTGPWGGGKPSNDRQYSLPSCWRLFCQQVDGRAAFEFSLHNFFPLVYCISCYLSLNCSEHQFSSL